ncbi:MAG: nitroreductase family protein [Anaerolineae bacterium]
MTDWTAAMQRRYSVRRFSSEPPTPAQLVALKQAVEAADALDASVPARLLLLPFSDIGKRRSVAWLPIHNAAPWYLVLTCADVPGRMEEVGFRGEQVVLAAAAQGLDTCWVGGTFAPDAIAAVTGVPVADVIAIIPIGRAEKGAFQAITSALTRPMAGRAGKRKPLAEFTFADRWGQPADRRRVPPVVWQALEMARIAPSWANTQPWAFLLIEDVLWALADSRPQRGNNVPAKPYSRLDAGIAMAHVHLAMKQEGYSSMWRPPLDPLDASLAVPAHFLPIAWRPVA